MKNLKELKTTFVGILFLLVAFDYELTKLVVKVEDPKELYFIGGIIIGVGLLLAPDSIIEGLKNLVSKKTK
jgi:uncharacterized membrane protein